MKRVTRSNLSFLNPSSEIALINQKIEDLSDNCALLGTSFSGNIIVAALTAFPLSIFIYAVAGDGYLSTIIWLTTIATAAYYYTCLHFKEQIHELRVQKNSISRSARNGHKEHMEILHVA